MKGTMEGWKDRRKKGRVREEGKRKEGREEGREEEGREMAMCRSDTASDLGECLGKTG